MRRAVQGARWRPAAVRAALAAVLEAAITGAVAPRFTITMLHPGTPRDPEAPEALAPALRDTLCSSSTRICPSTGGPRAGGRATDLEAQVLRVASPAGAVPHYPSGQ
jgi:hypothetical protein